MAPPTEAPKPAYVCDTCRRPAWHVSAVIVCKECLKKVVSPPRAGDRRVQMDFAWLTALWKGILTAAIAAAVIGGAAFFGAFDETVEWTNYGAPEWFAMIAVVLVRAAWDFIKRWLDARSQGVALRHRLTKAH